MYLDAAAAAFAAATEISASAAAAAPACWAFFRSAASFFRSFSFSFSLAFFCACRRGAHDPPLSTPRTSLLIKVTFVSVQWLEWMFSQLS